MSFLEPNSLVAWWLIPLTTTHGPMLQVIHSLSLLSINTQKKKNIYKNKSKLNAYTDKDGTFDKKKDNRTVEDSIQLNMTQPQMLLFKVLCIMGIIWLEEGVLSLVLSIEPYHGTVC